MRSPEQIIKRPLLTEKGTLLKDTGGHGEGDVDPDNAEVAAAVRGRERRQQGRDSPRRPEAVERRRRRRPHRDRARQGEAHGPLRRQAVELEEGDRDHRARARHDRILRGSVSTMGLRPHNATTPGSRGRVAPDFSELSQGNKPEKSLTEPMTRPAAATTTAASPRASAAAATSAATASSTSAATRLACRPRSRRSSTIRTAPRASRSLHYADGEKRYILAPRRPQGRRHGAVVGATPTSSRATPAAALHPARHDDPQHRAEDSGNGAQLVPLGRRRRAAHGQGRRLGPGSPALRRDPHACTSTAAPPSARSATSSTASCTSARPAARAGWAAARTTAASP